MLEIINLVQGWAGGAAQAMAWYRAEPIPAFGGRTAEALVKSGNATAVRDYVDQLAPGGYACGSGGAFPGGRIRGQCFRAERRCDVWGKGGDSRVGLGGRRIIIKKK